LKKILIGPKPPPASSAGLSKDTTGTIYRRRAHFILSSPTSLKNRDLKNSFGAGKTNNKKDRYSTGLFRRMYL
jgi:hypothetical protein